MRVCYRHEKILIKFKFLFAIIYFLIKKSNSFVPHLSLCYNIFERYKKDKYDIQIFDIRGISRKVLKRNN